MDSCEDCAKLGDRLQHILGGGKILRPDIMFVFINPTARNVSSRPDYCGPRFPFLGTKEVWNVFAKAGMFPSDLLDKINGANGRWDKRLIKSVIGSVASNGFYFTNVSKCCKENSELPNAHEIRHGSEILFKEICIVRPKRIVAFGLIPTKAVTGQSIRLGDQYRRMQNGGDPFIKSKQIAGRTYSVFPCYFPVGRGNPKRAVEMLGCLKRRL